MIINWKHNRLKFISVAGKQVTLLPGNNQVDNKAWEAVRPSVLDSIKIGDITEVNVEVKPKKGDDGKPAGVEISEGLSFNKMPMDKAEELVKSTFNLETLEAWKQGEGRDSIRALILTQMELVNSHGTKPTADNSKA